MIVDEILKGESKNLEFKVERPKDSIKYMKTVVAFANGEGGKIIFGVDDKTREVVGLENQDIFREMDAIVTAISDSCYPIIIPDVYLQTVNNKTIIIAEISPGKQRPYYIKSKGIENGTYVRVSGTTRLSSKDLTTEMYYENEHRSYDYVVRKDLTVTTEEVEDLCKQMKNVALANAKSEEQKENIKDVTKNVLINWGLLAEDDRGIIHPTNGYIYLLGKDPFLSQIQCGFFKGNTRKVFLDKREYTGPLWEQIDQAYNFVLRNIRLGAKLNGIYRQDIYELPPDGIRELIVNAVMNCSYLQNSHIQIAIFDNRLEITSPGGLMPGVTIERMKEGYSKIRNRALAHAFSYMNLIEGWGSGIPKLIDAMKECNLSEPQFEDMEIGFRVNLFRNPDQTQVNLDQTQGKLDQTQGKLDQTREILDQTQGKLDQTQVNLDQTQVDSNQAQLNPDQTRKNRDSILLNVGKREKNNSLQNLLKELNVKGKELLVLELILNDENITIKDMSNSLGYTESNIKYYVSKLRQKGLIKRIGTVHNGKWIVNLKMEKNKER